MRRRDFFGALLAGAAAFVVAPQVQAEAAPSGPQKPAHIPYGWAYNPATGNWFPMMDRLADARADAYERCRAVESARAESKRLVASGPEPWNHPESWREVAWAAPLIPLTPVNPVYHTTGVVYGHGEDAVVVQDVGPLTFEALAADCEALGCMLGRYDDWSTAALVTYAHGRPGDESYAIRVFNADDLARVDAWRRSLHEGGG